MSKGGSDLEALAYKVVQAIPSVKLSELIAWHLEHVEFHQSCLGFEPDAGDNIEHHQELLNFYKKELRRRVEREV